MTVNPEEIFKQVVKEETGWDYEHVEEFSPDPQFWPIVEKAMERYATEKIADVCLKGPEPLW